MIGLFYKSEKFNCWLDKKNRINEEQDLIFFFKKTSLRDKESKLVKPKCKQVPFVAISVTTVTK